MPCRIEDEGEGEENETSDIEENCDILNEEDHVDYDVPNKLEKFLEYQRLLAEIKQECINAKLSPEEFDKMLTDTLNAVKPKENVFIRLFKLFWFIFAFFIVLATFYALLSFHSPTQKTLSKHIQEYIYPVMRTVRFATLPILRKYPEFTEWHEEPCLINNPLYGLKGPDCWPCETVRSVLVLDQCPADFIENYYHNGQPFVISTDSDNIGWDKINNLIQENKDILRRSAARFTAENYNVSSLPVSDLFKLSEQNQSQSNPESHFTWKITRSDAARVLRKLYPKPNFVPDQTEVAIQRFLFIDFPQAPAYDYPLTDFANVWVAQSYGVRLISLQTSPHCNDRCHSVSVLLKPGDLLFYNWQFWRPISFPIKGAKQSSVTYIGSFY